MEQKTIATENKLKASVDDDNDRQEVTAVSRIKTINKYFYKYMQQINHR